MVAKHCNICKAVRVFEIIHGVAICLVCQGDICLTLETTKETQETQMSLDFGPKDTSPYRRRSDFAEPAANIPPTG